MIKILNKKLKDSSRKWIARQVNDEFAKQKVVQGFRSRSAFKLLEIEKKFKIFKNNSHILDLGSSPGGWSQVLAQKIKKGKILAVDTPVSYTHLRAHENREDLVGRRGV